MQRSLPVHMDQVRPLAAPTDSRVHVDKVSSDKDCGTTVTKKLALSLKQLFTHGKHDCDIHILHTFKKNYNIQTI